ncbi:T-complex protein 11-like protein, partial [Ophiophagus hannah]
MDISNQICMEVDAIFNQLGYPALSTDKATSLKGQLRNLGDKNNAVRVLIEQRIQTFLRHCLYPGGQNAKNLLQGLNPIQEEVLEIGQRFGSLIHHNRQVFGPYYSEILKKLLLPGENYEKQTTKRLLEAQKYLQSRLVVVSHSTEMTECNLEAPRNQATQELKVEFHHSLEISPVKNTKSTAL